jgi:hypothetical protein
VQRISPNTGAKNKVLAIERRLASEIVKISNAREIILWLPKE